MAQPCKFDAAACSASHELMMGHEIIAHLATITRGNRERKNCNVRGHIYTFIDKPQAGSQSRTCRLFDMENIAHNLASSLSAMDILVAGKLVLIILHRISTRVITLGPKFRHFSVVPRRSKRHVTRQAMTLRRLRVCVGIHLCLRVALSAIL